MRLTEDMTHIVLEHLRRIRARVDEIEGDLKTQTSRFDVLEGHLAQSHVSEAVKSSEIDRIERRLELSDR